MTQKPKFETIAIKSTENKFSDSTPVSTPIYLSSTYKRNSDGSYTNDFVYSRANNPNRAIVEESIAPNPFFCCFFANKCCGWLSNPGYNTFSIFG